MSAKRSWRSATAGRTARRSARRDEHRRLAGRLLAGSDETLARTAEHIDQAAWDGVLAALSPAMLPYLEYRLRTAGASAHLPPSVQESLRTAARAGVVAHLQRRAVLQRILTDLDERGITAFLLKGVALANGLYPEPGLRPMTDIDVRVCPSRLDEAVRCLLDAGFEIPKSGLRGGVLSPRLSQRRLRLPGTPVLVELHGTVRSLEVMSADRQELCWQRAIDVGLGDREARMLCPSDALLHTCLHLAMTDGFAAGQVPLLDLRMITMTWSDRLDWDALADDCREQRIAAPVAVSLKIAGDLLGAVVPARVRDAAAALDGIEQIEVLALEQVWESGRDLPYGLDRVLRAPSGRGRVTRLARRIFLHPWVSSQATRRGPREVFRQAAERLTSDITVKIPAYAGSWARGDLSGAALRRRGRLARRRGRLETLVRRAQAQLDEAAS